MNKFIGTWKGVYNNKDYEFVVEKISKYYEDMLMDLLIVRYKITENSGALILSTLNLLSNSPYVLSGNFLSPDKKDYVLRYRGYNMICGQAGWVTMASISNNPNQIRLALSPEGTYPTCTQQNPKQLLPLKDGVILTKQ